MDAGYAKALQPLPLYDKAKASTHPPYGEGGKEREAVVYFPSCINQTMGLAKKSPVEQPLVNKMVSLLQKAGYEIIFPKDMDKLCCGTIWESKGMLDIADRKTAELRPHFGKPANKANTPSSVTKALVCTACANVSRK